MDDVKMSGGSKYMAKLASEKGARLVCVSGSASKIWAYSPNPAGGTRARCDVECTAHEGAMRIELTDAYATSNDCDDDGTSTRNLG